MLRLAIIAFDEGFKLVDKFDDELLDRELTARLRGASAEIVRSTANADPSTYDAAVFVGDYASPTLMNSFLKAGKHVLLATGHFISTKYLEAYEEFAGTNRARYAAVNLDRYLPSRQLIKQQLDSGKLGDVGQVRIHRWTSKDSVVPLGPPFLGASLLSDLDLTMWLVGKVPTHVFALGQREGVFVEQKVTAAALLQDWDERNRAPYSSTVQTAPTAARGRYVQVHLGFPGGGMALIDESSRLPAGEGYQSLSVIGSRGAAYADDHQNTQLLFGGDKPQGILASERMKQLVSLLQDFVDGLQAGPASSICANSWNDVERVALAVRESIDTRQAVTLEVA